MVRAEHARGQEHRPVLQFAAPPAFGKTRPTRGQKTILLMPLPSRQALLALFLVFTTLWFGTLDQRKLIRPDEGRYAEIAREMALSGDFVTPRLNGLKYFEKPPLQYWATALAFRSFGEEHWVARLWPALTGFLALLLVGYAAHTLWGAATGIIAFALLGSMSWQVVNSHFLSLDMGLAAFLTLALCAFLLAQAPQRNTVWRRRWMLAAWIGMALAVLSKGLVGLVIPGASLLVYTIVQRDWALWKRLEVARGLPLFLLIVAPWFLLCARANPEFAHFFFVHEHFERYLTAAHRREGAWHYFLPLFAAGVLPWLPHLLIYGWRFWPHTPEDRSRFSADRLLGIWAGFIFVFFSASSSKLPSYILPMFPALALLLARQLQLSTGHALGVLSLPLVALGLAGVILAEEATSQSKPDAPLSLYQAYVPWIESAGLSLAVGALVAMMFALRDRVVASVLALAGGGMLAATLVALGHDALSPAKSAYHLVREIEAKHGPIAPEMPFYSVETYDQTLPFYLKRTLTLVNYRDEFALGLEQEPEKGLASFAEFAALWPQHALAYALVQTDRYGVLQREQLPHRVLASNARFTIIARP
jgi:4-amino-4-deoxy-L-arabinose transferase-like glycosyltransferase